MRTSCHCGRIAIDVAPPPRVTCCNCSVCSRYQALWGYYQPHEVTLEVEPGCERAYTWGDRELEFVHCSHCGCITHYRTIAGQPDPRIAVNFRMLVEGTVDGIPVRYFDGKNMR